MKKSKKPKTKIPSQLDQALKEHDFINALALAGKATQTASGDPSTWKKLALCLKHNMRFDKSAAAYQRAISLDPQNPALHSALAAMLLMINRPREAQEHISIAETLDPDNSQNTILSARAILLLEGPRAASQVLIKTLQQNFNPDQAIFLLHILITNERWADAATVINFAVKHASQNPPSDRLALLLNLSSKIFHPAMKAIRANLLKSIEAEIADDVYFRGRLLFASSKYNEAEQCFVASITEGTEDAEALYWAGNAALQLNNFEVAIERFEQAIELNPFESHYHQQLGMAFNRIGQHPFAERAMLRAISLSPEDQQLLQQFATLMMDQRQAHKAYRVLDKLRLIDPENKIIQSMLILSAAEIANWTHYDLFQSWIPKLGVDSPSPPWAFLAFEDSPERQLLRSEQWAKKRLGVPKADTKRHLSTTQAKNQKIRLGYLSADFHHHATMRLISGLVREHDRKKFEIFWVSYGKFHSSETRQSLQQNGDRLVDINNVAFSAAITMIKELELDIVIDLKGFTQDERSTYFSQDIAPLKIQYLGYPGTLGTPYFDYLIGDKTVISAENRPFHSESIIYLPNCYQSNDNQRPRPVDKKTKKEHGLSENSLIICCFNQTLKINKAEFELWLDVLKACPDTQLWLLGNSQAPQNLKKFAELQQIDPGRLVFAKRVPNDEHLARHIHADICVDTFFYNAHTTASDALWMGIPFVTKIGKQFSARVCASLLRAMELDELITETDSSYKDKIIELIQDSEYRNELKKKISSTIHQCPLFDTVQFTRDYESGLISAYDLMSRGEPLADITV